MNCRAIFAAGCFWGVEYQMKRVEGVLETTVGYIGGDIKNPTYEQVKSGTTRHAEAVEIVYDPNLVTFRQLAILFFEIHDSTQRDGQGPDIGEQYRSEVFYTDDNQRKVTEELIEELRVKGYDVVTKMTQATTFYKAEDYHQDYYDIKGTEPYCHTRRKIF